VKDGIMNGAECRLQYIEFPTNNTNFPKQLWVEFTDKNIGSITRKSVPRTNVKVIHDTWTPIIPIQRTFTVRRDHQRVTRLQFPLQLAAARTIHKAQSSTYENIVVDMSTSGRPPAHFWEHMHYVAFSRCTSMAGLHIVDINATKIRVSPKVQKYIETDKKQLQLCYTPTYSMNNDMHFAYNNVGSIQTKWSALCNNWNLLNCDIITFAETWLKKSDQLPQNVFSTFSSHQMDSTIVPGHRGMLMYTSNTLTTTNFVNHQHPAAEFMLMTVQGQNSMLNVITVYRPPSTSITAFRYELEKFVSSHVDNGYIIIMGDFNINVKDSQHCNPLSPMLKEMGLQQHVTKSTTTMGTTIDLVYTNIANVSVDILPNTWSSHHTIIIHVPNP
jgi:exonuclease III